MDQPEVPRHRGVKRPLGGPFLGILRGMRSGAPAVVGGVAMVALAACTGTSSGSVSLPPTGASASVVLNTYLRALVAGDCTTARALATSTFRTGNGELCGDVKVSAFSLSGDPAAPGPNEVVYGSVLTTEGSSDGTIAPGKTTWFYDLKRQGGAWKLVGGGSGP